MTNQPPQPTPIQPCPKPECRCGRDDLESARLRKLLETLRRNLVSADKLVQEITEIEERKGRAA